MVHAPPSADSGPQSLYAAFASWDGLVEQFTGPHIERPSEFLDDRDCRVASSALDIADIGAMDAGAVGIVFLAPALRLAKATNVSTKARADIHERPMTPVSPIDLQTMSVISR